MLKKIFLVYFLVTVSRCDSMTPESICALDSCASSSPPVSSLELYCKESRGLAMRGRCCVYLSDDTNIMGVDLSFCNLTSINRDLPTQAPQLLRVNLTNNPNLKLDEESFKGLRNLTLLSLPSSVGCPGNHTWFNATWQPWRITIERKFTICSNQTNTCHKLDAMNYTCPIHSTCHNNGPGMFACGCDKGWGGYKCLRLTHGYPTLPIVLGSAGSSIVLSALLWWSQRRYCE